MIKEIQNVLLQLILLKLGYVYLLGLNKMSLYTSLEFVE